MLIRFAVENWMSFRDEAVLSMIASSERQHSHRLRLLSTYRTRILPIASIYGGNASGKSNLTKALRFAQNLIVNGPKPGSATRVRPFRLEKQYEDQPTKFRFEILIDKSIYEYSFSLTTKRVVEEQLKHFRATKDEVLFRRTPMKLELSAEFTNSTALQVNFQGTQDNQLYLTNSVSQKRSEFRQIFDWFDDVLTVIFPHSFYGGLPYITSRRNSTFAKIVSLLGDLDSGISNLQQVEIPIERVPSDIISGLEHDSEDDITTFESPGDGLIFISKKKDKVVAKRLTTIHKSRRGDRVDFGLDEESDGTRRLLDLLPAFVLLEDARREKVFVIDEFDRSLHPLLAKKLLDRFLAQAGALSSSQLIYTTHNVQLMDQRMLRRDEIWITERDNTGNSTLVGLSEFRDVRNDKDIRKSYLQGRMGGVPRLKNSTALRTPTEVHS